MNIKAKVKNLNDFIREYEGVFILAGLFIGFIALCIGYREIEENKINNAWATISRNAPGNSGKIYALEYLASKGEPLPGLDMTKKANKGAVYLEGLNLGGRRVNLRNSGFSGAKLAEAIFDRVDLSYSVFDKADLHSASFRRAVLFRNDFSRSDLSKVSFEMSFLHQSLLRNTILLDAHFEGADLYEGDFDSANLTNAHFEGANLFDTNFFGANLVNTFFEYVDLSYSDFTGAKNIDRAIFKDCFIAAGDGNEDEIKSSILPKFDPELFKIEIVKNHLGENVRYKKLWKKKKVIFKISDLNRKIDVLNDPIEMDINLPENISNRKKLQRKRAELLRKNIYKEDPEGRYYKINLIPISK